MSKQIGKIVTIEEDYLEFHGQIYYAWRAEGAGSWNFKLTAYKQLPYVRWSKLTEVEYTDRLRRYDLKTVDSRKQTKVRANTKPKRELANTPTKQSNGAE